MVAIAFAAVAPSLGLAGAGIGTAATVAGIGLGLLAAYVDSTVTYPALFGKKPGSRPDALEGFQISTTDPGAPRWEVYGSRAWVPCHYLWTLGTREETSGGSAGKGGRPIVAHVRADVGLGLCDGPINSIVDLYADERVFWSRQFNRVVIEDHRWAISAGTGGSSGHLIIEATDSSVVDFSGVFRADPNNGDVVRLERVLPNSLNGYYRVVIVAPHSGSAKTRIELLPLRSSQVPAAGTAGSSFEAAALRRIDQGNVTNQWGPVVLAGPELEMRMQFGAGLSESQHRQADPPFTINDLNLARVAARWQVGADFVFQGMSPSTADGRYRLIAFTDDLDPTPPNIDWIYRLKFRPLDGQAISGTLTPGTTTDPLVVVRVEGGGFTFFDAQQEWREYLGSRDQSQDPTLALYDPDAPAHRGIAHMSMTNWTLAPHGNIIPRVTGMVRARSGETVASVLQRICLQSMPSANIDTSKLRTSPCLGYSVPGGMPRVQAIQPLLTAYAIHVQDRGGVLTFLNRSDLPVVPVPTRHLNARPASERVTSRGFVGKKIDTADVPERVLVQYLDPAEGANESEGDGRRSPGDADRGSKDTLDVNLKPLVMWGYEAKRLARTIRRELSLEAYQGAIRLGPGFMDVIPGHCLTFASNDAEVDEAPAGATIDFDTTLRDLVAGSVRVHVRFAGGQVATLVDNGGFLEGLPAGITATVNEVDYANGHIGLECSEDLDETLPPLIAYRYERQWLLRASRATLGGYDFGVSCEVVSTTTDAPLPPVPRRISSGLGAAIVSAVPPYRSDVLDLPSLDSSMSRGVWVSFAVAPEPGAPWRGATVYQSPNGVDRWVAVGQVSSPTTMGTAYGSVLPTRFTGALHGVVDWTTELVVDLPNGETLESATTEMLGYGWNWALVGDEIIAFHEAEAMAGTQWVLRGLWRGRRQTDGAMNTHADGERFVLLFGMGLYHGLQHEIQGGYGAANRTYFWRVVPGGASISAVETITTLVRGQSARPPAPLLRSEDVVVYPGSHIEVRWWRRSREMTGLFGPAPLQGGWVEKYELVAFDALTAIAAAATLGIDGAIQAAARRRWFIGDELMGTPYVSDRLMKYGNTEMAAEDGFTIDASIVGIAVYAIGPAGKSEVSDFVTVVPLS